MQQQEMSSASKRAWTHRIEEPMRKRYGPPSTLARDIMSDPAGHLKRTARNTYWRICNRQTFRSPHTDTMRHISGETLLVEPSSQRIERGSLSSFLVVTWCSEHHSTLTLQLVLNRADIGVSELHTGFRRYGGRNSGCVPDRGIRTVDVKGTARGLAGDQQPPQSFWDEASIRKLPFVNRFAGTMMPSDSDD